MRHLITSVSAGLLLSFSLTGCGGDSSGESPEIDAWIAAQDESTAQLPDGTEVLSARENAGVPYRDDEGIRLEYEVPHQVQRITFSCFGQGSMDLEVSFQSPDVAQGVQSFAHECERSPHEIDLSELALESVTEISVQGYEASEAGAWSFEVEATQQ